MNEQKEQKLSVSKSDSWKMFNQISSKYDLLNRLLSLGLDISWRKKLSQFVPQDRDVKLLDLATGTADLLITLTQNNSRITKGVGLDMAEKMLNIGRKKIINKGLEEKLTLKTADANSLPFSDDSFDCSTISFGIRNVENPSNVLREMNRVLAPKGRALILEFSMPKNRVIRLGHVFYLRTIVPLLGWLVSGQYRAYKYLNQTIEEFPYGDDFLKLMSDAGFSNVKANTLLFGVATIYQGDIE